MILHLGDDEKVTNRAFASFEHAFPNKNYIICFSSNKTNHISIKENITFYKLGDNINIDFSKVQKVVIHFLSLEKINFCNKYIKSIPIYWIVWGADIYNFLLASKGYKLFSLNTIRALGKTFLGYCISWIWYRITDYKKVTKFINEQVDYIAADKGDFQLLQKKIHIADRIKQFDFYYYPIDDILGKDLINKEVLPHSKNILCGNSASFTNNHIDILKKIKLLKEDDYSIIMPLSYGGNKNYIKKVIEKGQKIYGTKFKPLTEFLPLDEYNKILQSSTICVFANWRQEAVGNIVIALYLGAKVYLSCNNPLLKSLIQANCKVFVFENETKEGFNRPLSIQEKQQNRKIMIEYFNSQRLYQLIEQWFN